MQASYRYDDVGPSFSRAGRPEGDGANVGRLFVEAALGQRREDAPPRQQTRVLTGGGAPPTRED